MFRALSHKEQFNIRLIIRKNQDKFLRSRVGAMNEFHTSRILQTLSILETILEETETKHFKRKISRV